MLTKVQLHQLKTNLEKRQTVLIEHTKGNFGTTEEFASESSPELSNYDNHPADLGTDLFERQKDVALDEHAETELKEINEALHALAEGTYGICSECGRDISFDRLEAIPTTDKCIDHADHTSYESRRPTEETVFSPNLNPVNVHDATQTGYDGEDAWQDVARYGTSSTPSDYYDDKADYNDMYYNSDEEIGGAEAIENNLSADIEGYYTGTSQDYDQENEDTKQ